jgi:fructokinase
VAWHLRAFGEDPWLVSRVGDDEDGAVVRAAMRDWGMDASGLQTDPHLPTGRVQVSIEDGEPAYDIVCPAAWDAIEAPGRLASGPSSGPCPCALLYHGSLALRRESSRRAWWALRAAGPATVFVDVNLRPPWWNRERVLADLRGAHFVKLNRDELERLTPGDARAFLQSLGLRGLLLTEGVRGACLLTADGACIETRPTGGLEVVDTVGAGDALAAIMILGLLRNWPLQVTLERAQAFASAIVGRRGATVADSAFYAPFAAQFGR